MPQVVTPGVIKALSTSLTDIFNQRLEAEQPSPFFQRAVMETESTTRYVNYAWITALGAGMRKWVGEREVQGGTLIDEYLIKNEKFELTVKVEIEDIEDGVYAFRSQLETEERADAYQRRKNDLIVDLLFSAMGEPVEDGDSESAFQIGTTVLGPDGVPYFSVNHPRGVQTKRVAANGTETYVYDQTEEWSNLTTAEFTEANLKAARTYLRKQKDHYGRAARLRPNLLVVGPNLEDVATELLMPSVIEKVEGAGTENEVRRRLTNPLGSAYELLVLDELGESDAWFLLDTTRRVKPFIFQNRVRPQFQRTGTVTADAAEGLIDSTVFHQDAILFGVRARFGGGYGNPILGFGSTGTGDNLEGDALS